MAEITVGLSGDFLDVNDALASIPTGEFFETYTLKIASDAVFHDVEVPGGLQPTDTYRLVFEGEIDSRGVSTTTDDTIVTFPDFTTLKHINLEHPVVMGDRAECYGVIITSTDFGLQIEGSNVVLHNIAINAFRTALEISDCTDLDILHASLGVFDAVRSLDPDIRACLLLNNCSDIVLKNSAMHMQSLDLNRFALFADDATLLNFTTIDYNVYYTEDDAALMGAIDGFGAIRYVREYADFVSEVGQNSNSSFENPEFATAHLSVNSLSPLMNMADPVLDADLKGNPRYEKHTIGAYEIDSIITEDARNKILELLAGISTTPIDEVVLGDGGTTANPYERIGHEVGETALANQTVSMIIKPTGPFGSRAEQPGVGETEVAFSVTITALDAETANGGALLANDQFDHYTEIGLKSAGVLMLKRNCGRIPFDPLVTLDTQINIAIALS
jgi:hypothetical protein